MHIAHSTHVYRRFQKVSAGLDKSRSPHWDLVTATVGANNAGERENDSQIRGSI